MAVTIRAGRLVLVRHGKSEGGQVAVIEGHGDGLVTVRAWHAKSATFAEHPKSIPMRDVLGVPVSTDPRVKSAKAELKRRREPET